MKSKWIRLLFVQLLVLSCLAAGSCQPKENAPKNTPSRAMLPFGDLNTPANKSIFLPPGQVTGWALSEDGIEEVAIYIDRKYVTTAKTGIDRPDVAAGHAKFEGSAKAGWEATVDVEKLAKGWHEMVAQARTKAGAISDVGKIVFVVE